MCFLPGSLFSNASLGQTVFKGNSCYLLMLVAEGEKRAVMHISVFFLLTDHHLHPLLHSALSVSPGHHHEESLQELHHPGPAAV